MTDAPLILDGDAWLVPLPALRVAWQATPRLGLDLGAGMMPLEYRSHVAIGHLGVRWSAGDGPLGPYLLARAGIWDFDPDEGTRTTSPFAVAGGGLEYTDASGFSLWTELGILGLRMETTSWEMTSHDMQLGVYGSIGIGYRLGR